MRNDDERGRTALITCFFWRGGGGVRGWGGGERGTNFEGLAAESIS